jgi:hypothetical protein
MTEHNHRHADDPLPERASSQEGAGVHQITE